jgi:hypothetical protein
VIGKDPPNRRGTNNQSGEPEQCPKSRRQT